MDDQLHSTCFGKEEKEFVNGFESGTEPTFDLSLKRWDFHGNYYGRKKRKKNCTRALDVCEAFKLFSIPSLHSHTRLTGDF